MMELISLLKKEIYVRGLIQSEFSTEEVNHIYTGGIWEAFILQLTPPKGSLPTIFGDRADLVEEET